MAKPRVPRTRRLPLPYEPIDGEEWRPVVGYEDLYLVSDHGRVWGVTRPSSKGGLLRAGTGNGGYQVVVLTRNCRGRSVRVHTLVATAFHGPSDLPQVLHWDGNPANNRASNLRRGTARENQADLRRHRVEGIR